MAGNVRATHIRRNKRDNVTLVDPVPSGPNAGYYSEEYTQAVLRISAGTPLTEVQIEVWTFENGAGNDWIEDPTERYRTLPGDDYTRYFRAGPIDRFACRVVDIVGQCDIFWTFS